MSYEQYVENLECEVDRIFQKLNNREYYHDAVKLICLTIARGGRLHVCGIGKPYHIAGYFASLLSSIGIRAYVLDGTEASHGSSGQVAPEDLVIVLCYYGNPCEMVQTVMNFQRNKIQMLAVTGFPDSPIAKAASVHLNVHIEKEGDPLGKPPRVSMLSTLICLQNLSVILQEMYPLTPEQYVKWHPGGQLGQI